MGMVSAGSTGAAMAAAAIVIGRIQGVSRPAIASIFPTPGSKTVVLDSGANTDVTPDHLAQFGVMGSVAAQVLLGVDTPRVGLLSIGEEKGKGRDLERAALRAPRSRPGQLHRQRRGPRPRRRNGRCHRHRRVHRERLPQDRRGGRPGDRPACARGLSALDPAIQEAALPALVLRQRPDSETYGGAQLLGVKGVVVIAHGSSARIAIANALVLARDSADRDLTGRLADELAS